MSVVFLRKQTNCGFSSFSKNTPRPVRDSQPKTSKQAILARQTDIWWKTNAGRWNPLRTPPCTKFGGLSLNDEYCLARTFVYFLHCLDSSPTQPRSPTTSPCVSAHTLLLSQLPRFLWISTEAYMRNPSPHVRQLFSYVGSNYPGSKQFNPRSSIHIVHFR